MGKSIFITNLLLILFLISCGRNQNEGERKRGDDFGITNESETVRQDALYYWNRTGINYDFFKKHIKVDTCYQSPEIFIGCMEGVGSMLKHYKPSENVDAILVPRKYFNFLEGYEIENIENESYFRNLKFIKAFTPKGETRREFYQEQRRIKNAIIESWKKLYQDLSNDVDFNYLHKWVEDNIINENKYFESLIVGNAINVYLSLGADPHTSIMPFDLFMKMMKSNSLYYGIGARIRKVEEKFFLYPENRGPADRAGIKNAYELIKVDGRLTENMSLAKVVGFLTGEKGTRVSLSVKEGKVFKDVSIVRDEILNVSYKKLEDSGFGYISLKNFMSENACTDVKSAVLELEEKNVSGLILDLRENTGGAVLEAQCITGLFIGKDKTVIHSENLFVSENQNRFDSFLSTHEKVTDLPLVILVNAFSASASEVVSGALQDYGRALVIGTRTFGKGTVTQARLLSENKKIAFLETVSRFYLPSGRTNHLDGITPDFTLFETPFLEEEIFIERERERFSFVIAKNESISNGGQRDFGHISDIKKCVGDFSEANKKYDDIYNYDFQLLGAEDVLTCINKLNINLNPENFDSAKPDEIEKSFQIEKNKSTLILKCNGQLNRGSPARFDTIYNKKEFLLYENGKSNVFTGEAKLSFGLEHQGIDSGYEIMINAEFVKSSKGSGFPLGFEGESNWSRGGSTLKLDARLIRSSDGKILGANFGDSNSIRSFGMLSEVKEGRVVAASFFLQSVDFIEAVDTIMIENNINKYSDKESFEKIVLDSIYAEKLDPNLPKEAYIYCSVDNFR